MKNIIVILLLLTTASTVAQQIGNSNYKSTQYTNQDELNSYRGNMVVAQQAKNNPQQNQDINLTIADNNVTFTVKGLYNAKAIGYMAVFNLTQLAATAEEADRLLNDRLNSFKNDIITQGLAIDTNIFVDMVTFLPKYEYEATKKIFSKKTYTEVPKGFQLQKNVHIKYQKPNILDKIISTAAKYEIFELVKVDYIPENPDKIYSELRKKLITYLNTFVNDYKAVGMRLDTAYRNINERTWLQMPASQYQSYEAFASTSLDVLDKGANIVRADKNNIVFYNPIKPDYYDIIINPIILEPVVQYSMIITAQFTYRKKESLNKYYTITPNGDVKYIFDK